MSNIAGAETRTPSVTSIVSVKGWESLIERLTAAIGAAATDEDRALFSDARLVALAKKDEQIVRTFAQVGVPA
jgi:hypothetical protein